MAPPRGVEPLFLSPCFLSYHIVFLLGFFKIALAKTTGDVIYCVISRKATTQKGASIMASVQRQPGQPNWIAHFYDKSGRRRVRSTRLPNTAANKKQAQKIADSFEEINRARNAVKALRDNYATIAAELNIEWKIPNVRDFLDNWMVTFGPKLADSTRQAYGYRFNDLMAFLKETGRDPLDVDMVTLDVAREYRDRLLSRVSTVTANTAMTVLSGVFSYAVRKGYLVENGFDVLGSVTETDATEKRPFTLDELKLVLENCNPEWRSLVLFGLYTGQRLSDLATLTWNQIDLKKNEVAFITKKTGRRMALPIAEPLREHIDTLSRGTPDAPVHPEADRMMSEQKKAGTLSRQFNEILQRCNLVPKKLHRKGEKETGDRRQTVNPLSFHSLRHTAATLLRMTGSSEAVAREIIGHDSASVDRGYVHMDAGAMRDALNRLPKLA